MITKEMKVAVIAVIVMVISAYFVGRRMAPEKVRVETKTVEVEKVITKIVEKEKVSTHTTIIAKPDGSTVTTIDQTAITDTHTGQTVVEEKKTDQTSETTRGTSKVTISALAGVKPFGDSQSPVYGGAVTKPILGPITVGAFFLTNGTVGGMLGLTF